MQNIIRSPRCEVVGDDSRWQQNVMLRVLSRIQKLEKTEL